MAPIAQAAQPIIAHPPQVVPEAARVPVPPNWQRDICDLILVAGMAAVGSFFSPSLASDFRLGLVFTACVLPIDILIARIVVTILNRQPPSYADLNGYRPLFVTCIGPVVEEGLFRGVLQPLLELGLTFVLPVVAIEVLGAQMALATLTAIVVSAIIFGASHMFNPHQNRDIQSIFSTFHGIANGFITARYSLLSAMVVHMVYNYAVFVTLLLWEFYAQ